MKKVIQPNVRKVYGTSVQQHQTESQINAVRKINTLLSSGAVSVTGPNQSRILKQKPQMYNSQQQKCYVCDEACNTGGALLLDTYTSHSQTKLPNKIGRLIGDAFLVIVRADDVVCKRCVGMFNRMDNYETELERIRTSILGFICRKYGITEDEIRGGAPINSGPPPSKVQKIATPSGMGTKIVTRVLSTPDHDDSDDVQIQVRKTSLRSDGDDSTERTMPALVRTSTNSTQQVRRVVTTSTPQGTHREPIKIYRCASCDHTTPDLKQFQSHYENCRSTWPCKVCKRMFTTSQALKLHTQEKHPQVDYTCSHCNLNFMNDAAYKRHIEVSHPDAKATEAPTTAVTTTTQMRTSVMYTCSVCGWKTGERQVYEEHVRKHNKMKPFKCRICNQRFETRESASKHAKTHQPDYFKCGDCATSFPQRELLMKHFEVHHKGAIAGQTTHKVVTSVVNSTPTSQSVTTQKLLQETIDEALRDTGEGIDTTKGIHFFSCNICSLTFIQETYYNQHMETHKRDTKKVVVTSVGQLPTVTSATSAQRQSLIRQDVRTTNATILGTQSTTISDADLESIFEKMHADKGESEAVSAVQTTTSDNLVITKQSTAGGGITYNITIPQQQEDGAAGQEGEGGKVIFQGNEGDEAQVAAGIDMPVLDNLDESEGAQQQEEHQQEEATEGVAGEEETAGSGGAPVSMPSLDDDGDSQSQTGHMDGVPMELDEMQSGVEGEQIKFILNENGQLLQLDNHIITTDAEGNQIIVQGADSEHLQQLLQSVAGLDGNTIQMIGGENNQMILVQQGDGEPQLIDASLLNADGHIVIQQAQDGESQSSEDVSTTVAYTTSGQEDGVSEQTVEESVVQQHDDADVEGHEVVQSEPMETEEEVAKEVTEESEHAAEQEVKEDVQEMKEDGATEEVPVTSAQTAQSSEVFFNIDDLMGQPEAEQK
uniref:Putative c2h2-type zn-finger protein n=1 Tax=Nyssomyia neivai TaxID=330878 RepID=A0A1L8DGQ7_9DIPT